MMVKDVAQSSTDVREHKMAFARDF